MLNFPRARIRQYLDSSVFTLLLQHRYDFPRRAVAKKLPQSLLVIANAVLLHQSNKIPRHVSSQCGSAKVRIGGKKIFRLAVQVRKVAASPAGDQNLFPDALGVFKHEHAASTPSGFAGAHETGGAAAQDDNVESLFPQS